MTAISRRPAASVDGLPPEAISSRADPVPDGEAGPVTDRDLVARFRRGDDEALGIIVERYQSPLLGFLVNQLRDGEEHGEDAHIEKKMMKEGQYVFFGGDRAGPLVDVQRVPMPPGGQPAMVWKEAASFYRQRAPEVLDHLHHLEKVVPEQAHRVREELAHRFIEFNEIRMHNPVEAERRLAIERMEFQSQRIGEQIQRLKKVQRAGVETDKDIPAEIAKLEGQLAELVAKAFDHRLEFQEQEVALMETELEDLREMIAVRRKNRDAIIEKRVRALTGERDPMDW